MQKKNTTLQFMFFILDFFKSSGWLGFLPVLFSLVLAVQETAVPWIIKKLIDTISLTDKDIVQDVIFLAVAYIFFTEIANVMFRVRDYYKLRELPRIKSNLLMNMYERLFQKKVSYYHNNSSGEVLNKITSIYQGIEVLFKMVVDIFLWRMFALLIAGASVSLVSVEYTALIFVWAVIFVLITVKLSKAATQDVKSFSKSRSKIFGEVNDSIINFTNIKLFGKYNHEHNRLHTSLKKHEPFERKMLSNILKTGFVQGVLVTILSAIVVVSLCYLKLNHLITVGDFAFVIVISGTIIRNTYSISADIVQFSKELGICVQAFESLAKEELEENKQTSLPSKDEGHIEFKNVRFLYNESKVIFNNLNLKIEAGQKIGIVGFSGGGKSTLINLINKFFPAQEGDVLIDGVSVEQISEKDLSRKVTTIYQDPILFNRTIYENIAFGSNTATEDEVYQAASLACCDAFIDKLPEKYNTVVGERGVKLSGGQKQRLLIARAFLKKSPIYIFDESTSSIDSITENKIQENIKKYITQSTAIFVAHRLTTLKNMDKIFVFKDGDIIESGMHDSLINQSGYYSKFWDVSSHQEKAMTEF